MLHLSNAPFTVALACLILLLDLQGPRTFGRAAAASTSTVTVTVTSMFPAPSSSLSIASMSTCPVCFNCATQGCGNFGTCGSNCTCMTGFGDVDCNKPVCGSTNTENSKRLVRADGETCACDAGFVGVNCNICQSNGVCKISGSSETPLCNKSPKLFDTGSIQCGIDQPILKAAFPGTSVITLDRTLSSQSTLGALWYNNDQQFGCLMKSCRQYLNNGLYSWYCESLQCECTGKNSAFCGGKGSGIDLSGSVKAASGTFLMTCQTNSNGDAKGSCIGYFSFLQSLFPQGLPLNDCAFGECSKPSSSKQLDEVGKRGLSSGEWAGIGVAIAILAGALAGFIWSIVAHIRAVMRPVPPPKEGVVVTFNQIGYSLPNRKLIINNVSGSVRPGSVMAIMGPSGAGKSTFLDILAGKAKAGNVTGTVLFDNVVVNSETQRNVIGFVDQEDVLMPTLTVRETLMFSAQLRLPESVSFSEKRARVDDVMQTLGLTHVADTRIGGHGKRGISGGEKRRVSIGVELVTSPSVLVLDEPTSGLDSFNALSVIRTMSDLAKNFNKTVIFTIHQPRSDAYTLFDQVLVLAKGRLLYYGSGASAAGHFRKKGVPCPDGYNMADHLLDLASSDQLNRTSSLPLDMTDEMTIEEVEKGDAESARASRKLSSLSLVIPEALIPVEKPKKGMKVGFFMQVKVLMGRSFKNLVRTPTLLYAHVICSVALGALVGGLYYKSGDSLAGIQNRLGSIIFILSLLGFSGLSAIGSFSIERLLFLRERSNGFYGPMSYFLTKVLFDIIPLRIVPAILMGSIAFFMIGFTNGANSFAKYISILIFFAAEIGLLCMSFAIAIHDIGTATLAGAIIVLFKMLFAGFMINQDAIPPALSWIQYLSFFRYAYEAMIVNDLVDVTIHDNVSGVQVTIPVSVVLQKFGFDINSYWRDFIVSAGLVLVLLVLNGLLVQFRLKETR